MRALSDLSPHWLREIENFFQTYKTLQDRLTHVRGWQDAASAWAIVDRYPESYTRLLTPPA